MLIFAERRILHFPPPSLYPEPPATSIILPLMDSRANGEAHLFQLTLGFKAIETITNVNVTKYTNF
jgi:hypothetical protein